MVLWVGDQHIQAQNKINAYAEYFLAIIEKVVHLTSNPSPDRLKNDNIF